MKLKVVGIVIICVCMCFLLTGCGDTKEKTITSEDTITDVDSSAEEQVTSDTTEVVVDKRTKITNTWMSQPKNVDYVWKRQETGSSDYAITEEYKRDNDLFSYVESVENGVVIAAKNNNTFTNEFYYYHYQGDKVWTSYVYFHDKYWDNWYFKGEFPPSPQNYCFGEPWDILDEYSDEHETLEIEGVGEIDTVKGVNDKGETYYYSKDLNMNVKIEIPAQSWTLIKYYANSTKALPHELPDMEALDAKAAKEAEEAAQTTTDSDTRDEYVDYYEDENGEIVVFDE